MKRETQTRCPHCGGQMVRWQNPPESTWSGEFQFVCFNDECPYFVRGWVWMKETVNVDASYRFRLDPETGAAGALAVWSKEALKSGILPEEKPAGVD